MTKTYTPVGWEAGELVSPAIADLTTGEVTPAVYSGTTPVTSANLRHMDDAIKSLYDEGASSKDIYIGSEEEAPEDAKIVIDPEQMAEPTTTENNSNVYSTEEQVIGKWINGEALYRKVINFGALPNATSKSVSANISNLSKITHLYGVATGPTGTIPVPYTHQTLANTVNMSFMNGSALIATGMDRSAFNECYVILEYTKTTN